MPSTSFENQNDPLSDNFIIPSPTRVRIVPKTNAMFLNGFDLSWNSDEKYLDGFILEKFDQSTNEFKEIVNLKASVDNYSHEYNGTDIITKYRLYSYVRNQDKSLKKSEYVEIDYQQKVATISVSDKTLSSAQVNWTHNIYNEASKLLLYRKVENSNFQLLSTFDKSTNSYLDEFDIIPDQNYIYKLVHETEKNNHDSLESTPKILIDTNAYLDVSYKSSASSSITFDILNPVYSTSYKIELKNITTNLSTIYEVNTDNSSYTESIIDNLNPLHSYQLILRNVVKGIVSNTAVVKNIDATLYPIKNLDINLTSSSDTYIHEFHDTPNLLSLSSRTGDNIIPQFWDIETGLNVLSLENHFDANSAFAINKDFTQIFALRAGQLTEWDNNGDTIKKYDFNLHKYIFDLVFIEDKNEVLVFDENSVNKFNIELDSLIFSKSIGNLRAFYQKNDSYYIFDIANRSIDIYQISNNFEFIDQIHLQPPFYSVNKIEVTDTEIILWSGSNGFLIYKKNNLQKIDEFTNPNGEGFRSNYNFTYIDSTNFLIQESESLVFFDRVKKRTTNKLNLRDLNAPTHDDNYIYYSSLKNKLIIAYGNKISVFNLEKGWAIND
ncbi:MAG: hypothetical protein RIE52_13085 [Balneola sp.]